MKITKDSIRAMARHVWSGHQLVRDHELIHPERDWLIGLLTGVILMSGIIGWSVQLYGTYRSNPERITTASEADSVIYRAPLVETAHNTILERRQAAIALLPSETSTLMPVTTPTLVATTTTPDGQEQSIEPTPPSSLTPREESVVDRDVVPVF
jgi:hypothetical protein